MLTGTNALIRALSAARIKAAWSYPGEPFLKVGGLLDSGAAKGVTHRYVVNDQVAVSMALGGALLRGNATCALVKHIGVASALEALGTFGLTGEFASAALVIEGVDPGPTTSHGSFDNRGALSKIAHLVQLEAAAPDELYHFTRLGARLSLRTQMPVVLRLGARGLDSEGDARELPPDPLVGDMIFSRSAGPFVCTAGTHRFHVDKRARRLRQLSTLVETLAQRSGQEGARAVVFAGHLGAKLQNRASRHGLPSLRLAAAYPLPRRALLDFFTGREEILVFEEGEPFLEEALQAFAQREGLTVKVRGADGARPLVLDEERIDKGLSRFSDAASAVADVGLRDAATWKRAYDAVDAIGIDDGEPWALHLSRMRRAMKGFAADDPRALLLSTLRKLDRPTVIVGEPGNLSVLGLRDRLVDVKMHMGSAAPIAGALCDAAEIEERPGAPLAVALMSDTSQQHSGLLGMLDNVLSKREVLHVVVMHKREGAASPALDAGALEATLRGAGMLVSTVSLSDPQLPNAVAQAASRMGPRALLCVDDLDDARDEHVAE